MLFSQNLIPNPSFEEYTSCPNYANQVYKLVQWFNPATTFGGTPDYFNECAFEGLVDVPANYTGFQTARTGQGYCGMILFNYNLNVNYNYHEFIEAPLATSLQQDSCYYFEMFVCLSEYSHPATDDIGVYFSDTIISGVNNYYPLPFIPQIVNETGFIKDRENWIQITGEYVAHGGEQYVIIGNFTSDSMTSKMITPGCCWAEAYVLIDDVSLRLSSCLTTDVNTTNTNNDFHVYPNPVEANSILHIDHPLAESVTLEIFNSLGQAIHSIEQFKAGQVDLSTLFLVPGTYYVQLRTGFDIVGNRLLIVK